MSHFLLDTHVWYWLLGAVERDLSLENRNLLEAAARDRALHLSAMSIWETAQKEASGKLRVSTELLMDQSFSDHSIRLVELPASILIAANRLPGTIHGDPVDRILVATARELGLTLVTHDGQLLRYAEQGHVRVYGV